MKTIIRRKKTEVEENFNLNEIKVIEHVNYALSPNRTDGVLVLVNCGLHGYYPGDIIKISKDIKIGAYSATNTFEIAGIGLTATNRALLAGYPINPVTKAHDNKILFLINTSGTLVSACYWPIIVLKRNVTDLSKYKQMNPDTIYPDFLEIVKHAGIPT